MSTCHEVFVTTLNTDHYLPGVLVLDKTIRDTCSHQLFVLVSRDLSEETYEALRRRGITYDLADDVQVDPSLLAETDPMYSHWTKTFFKFRIFELTQFDKIVYIDCDIMVLESIDDLFERADLSAVIADKSHPRNKDWRDLNSGVMVIVPRAGIFTQLVGLVPAVAAKKRSFGDQDVLAEYFSQWEFDDNLHLPENYNVFIEHYQFYLKRGGVKTLHFAGAEKPWAMKRRRLFVKFLKFTLENNLYGIGMLLRYRRYLKEVDSDR